MKKYLNDVVVIRIILIVLLVLYHAFAIYCGAWKMPEGIDRVETYWWIASFSFSFMLETFVFVSGYCFGVYICQQFILMPFVHNHAIVNLFGTYWLPWIGFVMSLIVSVVITKLLLRTSIGRFLIG